MYNDQIKNIEDKILDITNLSTSGSINAKISEVKSEVANITNLATTSAFNAVENKIPSVSNLVKKTDYNIEINETEKKITVHSHDEYITTQEFNKFATEIFALRLKRAHLASNSDIANFVNTKL